ncbi:MAG: MerR family transcriptional regulator [Solibacillus sp.]
MKIGELAAATGMTKRTIDYYTTLGLLQVERSASNYRYYDKKMIDRIHWIEEQKSEGKGLQQIAALLGAPVEEEIDVQDIRLQMRKLEQDVRGLMNQLDDQEKENLKKNVTPESVALMQSLFLLLNS